MIRLTLIIILLLAFVIYADPGATSVPAERDFMKELSDIKSLVQKGDAEVAASQLSAFAEKLKLMPDLSAEKRVKNVKLAIDSMLGSSLCDNEKIKEVAAKVGLDVVAATKSKGIVSSALMEEQLDIALSLLPRTSAPADQVSASALELWANMLAARQHLSIYDSANPNRVKLEIPVPPANYNGPFVFGMDPSGITDPTFRQQYADFLKKRDEYNKNNSEYNAICNIKDHFLPKLKLVLKAAYSGDVQKENAGVAAVEKHIVDEAMRKELIGAFRPAATTRPTK